MTVIVNPHANQRPDLPPSSRQYQANCPRTTSRSRSCPPLPPRALLPADAFPRRGRDTRGALRRRHSHRAHPSSRDDVNPPEPKRGKPSELPETISRDQKHHARARDVARRLEIKLECLITGASEPPYPERTDIQKGPHSRNASARES